MPDAPGLWLPADGGSEYRWLLREPEGEQGYSGVPSKDQVKIDPVADLALSRVDTIVFGDWQPPSPGLNCGGGMSNA